LRGRVENQPILASDNFPRLPGILVRALENQEMVNFAAKQAQFQIEHQPIHRRVACSFVFRS
jgi:hypothetical protein